MNLKPEFWELKGNTACIKFLLHDASQTLREAFFIHNKPMAVPLDIVNVIFHSFMLQQSSQKSRQNFFNLLLIYYAADTT